MNYEKAAERAVEMKRSGYNCCQSVVLALTEGSDSDPKKLRNIAAGFAGGMGGMEATCGALIGAAMAAGIKTEGAGTVLAARVMSEKFHERCGATICRELKGIDSGAVLCPCDDCVRNAVAIYGEVMGGKN